MYRIFLSIGLLSASIFCTAQSYVHQVLVLNEGYYDFFGNEGQLVPVTIGSYDPSTGSYQSVATIEGSRFGSDVLVDAGSIYVAADDLLLRYDADSYALLETVDVPGVRKLAIWNDQLLLTRGELGGVPHTFEARDKNDLSLVYSIGPDEGLPFSAEDVLVHGDVAYLAVNNAFEMNDVRSLIGTVDLNTRTYGNEIDLGPEGLNPERLMEKDGVIYAFSNTDFTRSSVSRLNEGQLEYVRTVADNSGCSASALAGDKIYFMEYDQQRLARFDITTGTLLDTLVGTPAVYGLEEDPIGGVLYATVTDYFSTGELQVLSLEGELINSVPVSVSPGNLALDVRTSTGVQDIQARSIGVFPNPVLEQLSFTGKLPAGSSELRIMDTLGRTQLYEQRDLGSGTAHLQLESLSPGAYVLTINGGPGIRFVKQ